MRYALGMIATVFGLCSFAMAGPRVGNRPPDSGPRVGNGGGVWLCRDHLTFSIRWMTLTDLFEAQVEYGLSVRKEPGKTEDEIFADKINVIREQMPALQSLIDAHPTDIYKAMHLLPGTGALTTINDGLYRVRPAPATCENGYIYFAQIANFTDDGRLLINGALWKHSVFTPIDKAALLIHEVVYRALRGAYGDRNSSRTRNIVAHLFSDREPSAQYDSIQKVLATSAPPGEEASVSVSPVHLVCGGQVGKGKKVLESGILYRTGTSMRLFLANYKFTASTREEDGIPLSLKIENRVSGAVTSLDSEILQTAFVNNQTITLNLKSSKNSERVTLTCWTETYSSDFR